MKKPLLFLALMALIVALTGCAGPMYGYGSGPVVSGGGWVQTTTPVWTQTQSVWVQPQPQYGGQVYYNGQPSVQYGGYPQQGGGLTNPSFWYNTNQGLKNEMVRSCNAPQAVCQGSFYQMNQAPRY